MARGSALEPIRRATGSASRGGRAEAARVARTHGRRGRTRRPTRRSGAAVTVVLVPCYRASCWNRAVDAVLAQGADPSPWLSSPSGSCSGTRSRGRCERGQRTRGRNPRAHREEPRARRAVCRVRDPVAQLSSCGCRLKARAAGRRERPRRASRGAQPAEHR